MTRNNIPGACVTMPWFESRPGIFEIDEFDCTEAFLVVGQERALLIDTGTGIGDLKWLVENKLTDKPYTVVASHNHGDHIGGAGWFDEIWIHPADADWQTSSVQPTLEFRADYAHIIQNREKKYYAYSIARDIRPWEKTPKFLPLEDGQVFDLGGRTVTAYHCPGHTAGEMVFIDSQTKTLLCGDACNCNWLLNETLAPSIRQCLEIAYQSLKRIAEKAGVEYDVNSVFNSHHDFRGFGQELSPATLPNLLTCMQNVLDGKGDFRLVPDPLSSVGKMKMAAFCDNVMISCMTSDISKI